MAIGLMFVLQIVYSTNQSCIQWRREINLRFDLSCYPMFFLRLLHNYTSTDKADTSTTSQVNSEIRSVKFVPLQLFHWTLLTKLFLAFACFEIDVKLFVRLCLASSSSPIPLIQSDSSASEALQRVVGSTSRSLVMSLVASSDISDQYFESKLYLPRRITLNNSFWSLWWNGWVVGSKH